MNAKRYEKTRSATFNIGYHIIWCTKYRRKALTEPIQLRLKEVVAAKALELNVRIETIEVMPDHVHMFVKANPIDSPHHLVKHFKGVTSFTLRKEFPELKKRLPCLWTRSYYCESIGHISDTVVKKYIEDQKSK
jgi:putative transposase